MTVESTIRSILQGRRPRKGSSSINLREDIARPVSSQMQSRPGADDMAINRKPPLNTNTAAGDSTRTAPTQNPGTKAGDSSSTNQNPQSSQNQPPSEPTEYVDPNAGTMKERKPGESDSAYQFRMKSQQFELEKSQKYDEWKTKNDEWERKYGPNSAYQNQRQYDIAYNKNVAVGGEEWRDRKVGERSDQIEADRQAARQASTYVSGDVTNNFKDVEAARARAARARETGPSSKYEGPTRLSPEELAAKLKSQGIDKTPQQIQADRDKLDKMRIEFDKTRPEGQPASFTPEGKPPEQGKRADGTAVGPYTAPTKQEGEPGTGSSPEEQLLKGRGGSVGYGTDSLNPASNISGGGVASAGINEFQPIERKQFNFTNKMRENFASIAIRNARKRMISEAVNSLFGK